MQYKNHIIFFITLFLFISTLHAQISFDPDTVKAQKFDMGKMWTFEYPPLDYFESEYGFKPTEEWLNKLQKGALKFGGGCSASFLSEDGLIMTNHHCVRGILPTIQNEDENILRDGFYAEDIEDERQIPGLTVQQLIVIEDVTDRIETAMKKGISDSEKVFLKDDEIDKIKSEFEDKHSELVFQVTSLYNGGRYSLYGYKRYDDVRLVFVPELFVAKLGGDYDNFTYPRYGLDCAFLRAYENGQPIKTEDYFTWSNESIYEGQPVFVVGNPGSTDRINTIAQIEYERDVRHPAYVGMFNDLYKIYEKRVKETKAEDFKLIARLYSIGNGLKVYEGTYKGLLDEYLIARKKDFEKNFRKAVQSDPELNENYGHIWSEIENNQAELSDTFKKLLGYSMNPYYTSEYFFIAGDLIDIAEQLNIPEQERDSMFIGESLNELIDNLFPEDFNEDHQKEMLIVQANIIQKNLSDNDELLQKMFDGKSGKEAVDHILSETILNKQGRIKELAEEGGDAILNSGDPFLTYVIASRKKLEELKQKNSNLNAKDQINNRLLGEALFAVYGDKIPPDATGTLRIADGIIKGYDYNGTRAPYKTTFYGSLDRYYSFDKEFPFNLPDYWEDLPDEFDLSTPLDFVATNDIIGGNSGSPMLNIEGEVIGLAFDGNIESLPNRFIYTTEANRTVGVTAEGMYEAIKDLYKAERLAEELQNSKLD